MNRFRNTLLCLVFAPVFLLQTHLAPALPVRLGDLDEDGKATVLDLVRLINHINGSANQPPATNLLLASPLIPYADLNENGSIDQTDVDLLSDAILGVAPLPNPYSAPVISAPVTGTNGTSVVISGLARPNRTIIVQGGQETVFAYANSNGLFSVDVLLQTNRLNNLFLTAVSETFPAGTPQPLRILQDSAPPNLYIDFPTNNQILTTSETVIAGRVGDVLSGFMGLDVTVNSQPSGTDLLRANVNVGIGNNGTFDRSLVPLGEGTNVLTVVAKDILGNARTAAVQVVRVPLSGPRLLAQSGDLQINSIHRRLPQPIVVKAVEADGVTPIVNKLVDLQVTRSDGRLLPVNPAQLATPITNHIDYTPHGTMFLQLFTDANGEARAWWATGGDAGSGNNRVCVTGAGISNNAYFCASARSLPPAQINIGSGNNQKAEIGGPTPEPLRAWLSDGCNGVSNVLVTFRVIQGGALLSALGNTGSSDFTAELTVPTSGTGHASALCQLGPNAGQNIIEASYPGSSGQPATFVLYGVARDPSEPTTLTGLVLDNSSQPIGNVLCEIFVPSDPQPVLLTYTDTQGRFTFTNEVPTGPIDLFVYGPSATTLGTNTVPPGSFPFLSYPMVTIPNAENSLPRPVLLPRLNPNNSKIYYGTNDLVLTCEGIDGLKMTIKANSMRDARGRKITPQNPAQVALNQVHHDSVPMPIPDGAAPPFAWTLQPSRSTFDPPIQIEYPNMSGLPAGSIAYFLSYNHDTERFEIVASGHVIHDGSCIVTDPGVGLSVAGWGCNCPPYAVTGECQDEDCGCATADIASRKAALTTVAVGFALLPPLTGPAYAGQHLLHFLYGDGTDLSYSDDDAPVEQIKEHINFQAKHVKLLLKIQQLVFEATQAGQSTLPDFVEQFGGISFYEPGVGAFPTTQLSAGVGALSEGYRGAVSQLSVENDRILGKVEYTMRDHYIFDEKDCAFGGFDGMACCLQKCGSARPFYTHFHFTMDVDIPLPPAPSPILHAEMTRVEQQNDDLELNVPTTTVGWGLDETFVIQVGGQTGVPSANGKFSLRNISAPDAFGLGGPGTLPDFLSDDFVRLIGSSTKGGRLRYVFSNPFQFRQNEAFHVRDLDLTFTDFPPRVPESIYLTADEYTLGINQVTQVRTKAVFPDRTEDDVTLRAKWTSYRTSNPSIASVGPDGQVLAHRKGKVLITAVNEGAASVRQIDVSESQLTTVRGFLRGTNGVALEDILVSISGGAQSALTDANGQFSIPDVPTDFGAISVIAYYGSPGTLVFARAIGLTPVPGGFTDAGTMTLQALEPSQPPFDGGGGHSIALKADGTVRAWGYNLFGQLGDNTTTTKSSAVQIGNGADWAKVAGGFIHTLAIKTNGTLWAWGDNVFGQLGDGTEIDRKSPVQVGSSADWADVAAGEYHSLGLKRDGSLWGWGANFNGQLGDGSDADQSAPIRIGTDNDWVSVVAGDRHSLAIKRDGSLWAWGSNEHGQLGDGSGVDQFEPVPLDTDLGWIAITAGESHSLGLMADGSLWAWGDNTYGQLGTEPFSNQSQPSPVGETYEWLAVAAGLHHTLGLKGDGSVWAWGRNASGQLGDGTDRQQDAPVQVGAGHDWTAIGAGDHHSIALKKNGTLWTWGRNSSGQLGDGSTVNRAAPVQVLSVGAWKQPE
jgi:alpha-tubulin suppressor-like RCC1 family protein